MYSEFNLQELFKQAPIQNGGASASHIADVARRLLNSSLIGNSTNESKKIPNEIVRTESTKV